MLKILIVVVTSGWLAFNTTLELAGNNRQNLATAWPIDKSVDIAKYDCLIGVPYGYDHLIGHEVYFYEQSGPIHGPFLVTDVESVRHFPHMRDNRLAADIDCPHLVHKQGYLVIRGDDEIFSSIQKKRHQARYSRDDPYMPRPLRHSEFLVKPGRH